MYLPKKSTNLPRDFSNLRGRFVNLPLFFSSGGRFFGRFLPKKSNA